MSQVCHMTEVFTAVEEGQYIVVEVGDVRDDAITSKVMVALESSSLLHPWVQQTSTVAIATYIVLSEKTG